MMINKATVVLGLLGICWIAAGCTRPHGAPVRRSEHLQAAAVADETGKDTHSAVEAAQEWSRKYALLADDCMKLQQEKGALSEKNRELVAELEQTSRELARTQQELNDANAMLAELSKELGQWKSDVLGFRDEIRRAQQAQIDMMSRMIVLLGGEVPQLDSPTSEPLAARSEE